MKLKTSFIILLIFSKFQVSGIANKTINFELLNQNLIKSVLLLLTIFLIDSSFVVNEELNGYKMKRFNICKYTVKVISVM